MIFLIDYDRREGRLVGLLEFKAADAASAERARLELELEQHRRGILDREVVLLEASDEATLRTTHGRYFKEPSELISDLRAAVEASIVERPSLARHREP